MQTGLSNRSARLILALGQQRAKMPDVWQRIAVELAIKAIYEYETGHKMQWAVTPPLPKNKKLANNG